MLFEVLFAVATVTVVTLTVLYTLNIRAKNTAKSQNHQKTNVTIPDSIGPFVEPVVVDRAVLNLPLTRHATRPHTSLRSNRTIFQSYFTNEIPTRMASVMMSNFAKLTKTNPEWEYRFFVDADCRAILGDDSNVDYLKAFDTLRPGAYKCDVFRMYYLWKFGGLYIDSSNVIEDPHALESAAVKGKTILVSDDFWNASAVYQAILYFPQPGNAALKAILDEIVENVIQHKSATNNVGNTGPVAFGVALNNYLQRKPFAKLNPLQDGILWKKKRNDIIDSAGKVVMLAKYSSDWINDRKPGRHYGELFARGLVYNTDITKSIKSLQVLPQTSKHKKRVIYLSTSVYVHTDKLPEKPDSKTQVFHSTFDDFIRLITQEENPIIDTLVAQCSDKYTFNLCTTLFNLADNGTIKNVEFVELQ